MKGLMIRVIRQVRSDKRSVAMIIFAPLLVLTLIYFLLGDSGYVPTIAVVKSSYTADLTTHLKKQDVKLVYPSSKDIGNPDTYLKNYRGVDMVLTMPSETKLNLDMLESSAKSAKALKAVQKASTEMMKAKQTETAEAMKAKFTSTANTIREAQNNMSQAVRKLLSDVGLPTTLIDNNLSTASTAIDNTISSVNATLDTSLVEVKNHFVFGKEDESTFNSIGFVFLGFFSFFFVMLISGMALVRERSGGTLERFLMSPIKRGEVIFGYTFGFGFFAVIQAILIVVFSIYVLGLPCKGNVALVFLSMLLLAVVAVSFGALISTISTSELQVVQMVPITIIPQVFFSGLIPLDTIPYGLGNLCYLMPVYYGCTPIRMVMTEGAGFEAVWPYLIGLLAYASLLFFLNTRSLKRYRTL